jgi:hypothetical protein
MKEYISENCFRTHLVACIDSHAQKINFKASLVDEFPNQLKRFGLMVDFGEISDPSGLSAGPFSSLDGIATAFIRYASHAWPPALEYMGVPLEALLITPLEHSMEWLMQANAGVHLPYMPEVEDFDKRLITDRVLNAYLGTDGRNIRHLDIDSIADKYIIVAILKTPVSIEFIPDSRITREMVTAAINGDANAIVHINEKWQTADMVKSCVSRDGLLLHYAAYRLKTYENCKIAVGITGSSIDFVPPDIVDRDLCDLALKSEPFSACFFPPHLANFEEIVTSFIARPAQIRKVNFNKYRFNVDKMLTAVASRFPDALNFIPAPRMSHAVIMSALRASPLHLGYLPRELATHELCEYAVSRDPMAITYVPLDIRQSVSMAVKKEKQNQASLSTVEP